MIKVLTGNNQFSVNVSSGFPSLHSQVAITCYLKESIHLVKTLKKCLEGKQNL